MVCKTTGTYWWLDDDDDNDNNNNQTNRYGLNNDEFLSSFQCIDLVCVVGREKGDGGKLEGRRDGERGCMFTVDVDIY